MSNRVGCMACSGDVCATALGSGAIEDGALHICLGTSAWIGGFYPGRRLSAYESYATITSPINNRPLLIATQESSGACIDWLDSATGVADMHSNRRDDAQPPLFLPWLAGERVPADDNRLRATTTTMASARTPTVIRVAVRPDLTPVGGEAR